MSIAATLIPEFDQEMKTTRRVLEQIPEGRFAWKPHPKSWPMGGLAGHIANIPHWAELVIRQESVDVAPGGVPYTSPQAASAAELMAQFDRNVAAARAAVAGASDDVLKAPWSLQKNGETVFTMPRVSSLRFFVMNHLIHHRGQISLYFRLAELPVPSIYGPTGDGA